MKKPAMTAALLLLLTLLLTLTAGAAGDPVTDSVTDGLSTGELLEKAPDEVKDLLPGGQLTPSSLREMLSVQGVLDVLTNGLLSSVKAAVKDFGVVVGIVLVFVLLQSLKNSLNSDYLLSAFEITAALAISVAVFAAVKRGYTASYNAIEDLAGFMHTLMPVMASAITLTGAAVSSATLAPVILMAVDAAVRFNATVFLPLLNIYFSLSLMAAVSDKINISGMLKFVKNIISVGMGLILTLLVGVLSLQRVIAGASDNLAGRAAKFALGSFIPVVGGILKDVAETVFSAMGIIKSTAGVFGIVAIFIMLAPIVIRSLMYMLIFQFATALSKAAGESGITRYLENVGGVWSILCAVTVTEGMLMILSLGILLSVGVPQ